MAKNICIILNLVALVLVKSVQGLRYNYKDGSYYVGSVDHQGRPSGRGQYHNSSGDLGNFQTYYPFTTTTPTLPPSKCRPPLKLECIQSYEIKVELHSS